MDAGHHRPSQSGSAANPRRVFPGADPGECARAMAAGGRGRTGSGGGSTGVPAWPAAGEAEGDDLRAALEPSRPRRAGLPPPPASLPATAAERAAVWRDLARFRNAASDLGNAVAGVVAPPIAEWQLAFSVLSELRDQARALLPAPGEPQSELAAELEQLDQAVHAVPPPPKLRPATVEEISASARAIVTVGSRTQGVRRALVVALNLAIGAWDKRVAEATRLAAAVRGLLPYTGQQQHWETGSTRR